MTREEAQEYAKTMSYKEAVMNCIYAKGIAYRKATLMKLQELAEIADKLERDNDMTMEEAIKWLIKPTVTSTEVSPTKAKELEAYNMAIEALKGGDAEVNETKSPYMQQRPNGADLISRADAIERVELITKCEWDNNVIYRDEVIDALKFAPSADRPHGEWIMHIDDLFPEESTQECSNCHEHETIKIRNDNFCPNCGARMKGGNE